MSFQQDGYAARTPSMSSRDRIASAVAPDHAEKVSQIEKSVTHLLVATKQLLEILTAWSRKEATEVNVSDVYVRLGYEFNIACRAFNGIGVDTQDLGPVPDLLRGILEDTLSNEPSQASLEQYLPKIRDIIVNLLQRLKRKQQRLRQRGTREPISTSTSASSTDANLRQNSQSSSVGSAGAVDDKQSLRSSSSQRYQNNAPSAQTGAPMPYRIPSAPAGRASPDSSDSNSMRRAGSTNTAVSEDPYKVSTTTSFATTSAASITAQSPTPPYLSEDIIHGPFPTTPSSDKFPRPQPGPRQQDALAALQRGGDLERRASRRFSAYQIQKHLGQGSNGISMIPPTQHSPIPNRGQETKESMNAVRMRGSPVANKEHQPKRIVERSISPARRRTQDGTHDVLAIITSVADFPLVEGRPQEERIDSPTVKTPHDKLRPQDLNSTHDAAGPVSGGKESQVRPVTPTNQASQINCHVNPKSYSRSDLPQDSQTPPQSETKELTLFLQYKTKIKKIVFADGYAELSIARLQLAFIDKFAWNTHSNGVELPEIYIQDSVSGVRYELENLSDVKNNSVLALNIDALDDVKRHMDDGITSLKHLINGVRSSIDNQQSVLQLVSETQQDAAKSIARFNAAPPASIQDLSASSYIDPSSARGTPDRLREVQSLRRDLAVMRQTYTSLMSDMEASMTKLRAMAATVKSAAVNASLPNFDASTGRGYVDAGRKTLSNDSEKIINRVDDLQDVVEDLRKDVVSRGVRPLPRQLESVSKEISTATAELKKLLEFIKREKPIWTKIWRGELEMVYDDQKSLNMQEELAADLEKDLLEAANTFALVEEATKQQNVQNGQGTGTPTRSISRTLLNPIPQDLDPQKAKDGVLGEVRALQPNHETRLEAIERAEKARQKELENRKDGGFKKELNGFLDEGKLKKSGGVEEADRMRMSKDERNRREVWERMNGGASAVSTPVPVTLDGAVSEPRTEDALMLSASWPSNSEQEDQPESTSLALATAAPPVPFAESSMNNIPPSNTADLLSPISVSDSRTGALTPDFVEAVEEPILSDTEDIPVMSTI